MDLFVLTYLQSQYFWTAAAFLTLLFVISRYVMPAVLKTLDARAFQIASDLEEARKVRDEAEASLADYSAKIAAARKDATELLSKARAEAEALAKTRLQQAEEDIARKTEIARQQIEASKNEAIRAVKAEVAELAVQVAEAVLQQQVDAKTAGKLTDAALNRGLNG